MAQSEWAPFSGSTTVYAADFNGLAAKQMNDTVTAVVCNANGQEISKERSDSIVSYSIRMFDKAETDKLRTVYVDMLNYGAAAQVQFDYDEGNLANRYLTEEQQAYATGEVETNDNRVKGKGYAGTILSLESEIQLKLVFNNSAVGGSDYSDLYAIITYTTHGGTAVEKRIEGAEFIKQGSYCQVWVTGMAIADFRTVVNCVIYNGLGEEVANAADSVESYANRMASSLGATVDAIVKFGESSYNYFH